MIRRERGKGCARFLALWVAFLSLLANAGPLHAMEDCERLTAQGSERDCTFLEEVHECIDDANDSHDECVDDAFSQDGFFAKAANLVGCEAAWEFNAVACAIDTTSEWALGHNL